MNLRRRLIIVLAFASIGCVHTKSKIAFHEEAFRDPYWALVYVYREESATGGDVSWGVFLDENVLGRLRQGAYFTFHAAPGTHSVYVGGNASRSSPAYHPVGLLPASAAHLADKRVAEQIRPKEFRAKSGESYYFRCKGYAREFLTREQAIGALRTMKYDQGN